MAIHLYGVTRADAEVPGPVNGRGDVPVRLVADGDLAVIVSDVDLGRPAGPKDLLAHARVLEAYVEHETVVPMQFGIALPDDESVRGRVLHTERESLSYLLGAFDGLVQLTVQAFQHEEQALRQVLARDAGIREEREWQTAHPGAATQSQQVALGQAVSEVLEDIEEEDRVFVLDRLAPLAAAVAEGETPAAHQLLNAAFLVERATMDAFGKEVAALADEVEERIRLRFVGPQPPYSFLEPVRDGELVWD